jgi:hypothetical protein
MSSFRRHLSAAATAPRTIVLDELTAQALDRYLRVRAQHPHARSPRLLLGQRGPMTPDGARDRLNTAPPRLGSATCTRTASGPPSPTAGLPEVGRSGT